MPPSRTLSASPLALRENLKLRSSAYMFERPCPVCALNNPIVQRISTPKPSYKCPTVHSPKASHVYGPHSDSQSCTSRLSIPKSTPLSGSLQSLPCSLARRMVSLPDLIFARVKDCTASQASIFLLSWSRWASSYLWGIRAGIDSL